MGSACRMRVEATKVHGCISKIHWLCIENSLLVSRARYNPETDLGPDQFCFDDKVIQRKDSKARGPGPFSHSHNLLNSFHPRRSRTSGIKRCTVRTGSRQTRATTPSSSTVTETAGAGSTQSSSWSTCCPTTSASSPSTSQARAAFPCRSCCLSPRLIL